MARIRPGDIFDHLNPQVPRRWTRPWLARCPASKSTNASYTSSSAAPSH